MPVFHDSCTVSAVLFFTNERSHQQSLEGCRDVFEEELSEPANLTMWDIQIEKKRVHKPSQALLFHCCIRGTTPEKAIPGVAHVQFTENRGGREAEGMEGE